jgi:two-component system, OmpR family, KDP operon response regulator KdpE
MPYSNGQEKPFQYGGLVVDFARHEVYRDGKQVKLTPTEYQLLYHLTKNAGKVLTHRTLLGRVWGREYLDETNYLKSTRQAPAPEAGRRPLRPQVHPDGAHGGLQVCPGGITSVSH